MRRIATADDIAKGLDALCRTNPRLVAVRLVAGDVPLRLVEPGFASLVLMIVSQQVSRASAAAISGRLLKIVDPLTPETVLLAGEEALREAGLSRAKQRAVLASARAVEDGLDLPWLAKLDAEAAIERLTLIPGIGPWTAQVYLLFAAGHPDIFPARDIALQAAVGHAFALASRPDEKTVSRLAESWAPHRSIAARLFWAYYREIRRRDGAPVETSNKPGG